MFIPSPYFVTLAYHLPFQYNGAVRYKNVNSYKFRRYCIVKKIRATGFQVFTGMLLRSQTNNIE